MSPMLTKLKEMREFDGAVRTSGLPDDVIEQFAQHDPALVEAIDEAYAAHLALRSCMADLLHLDEDAQIHQVQADFVNFYPEDGVNPYCRACRARPLARHAQGRGGPRRRRLRHARFRPCAQGDPRRAWPGRRSWPT